MPHKNLTDAFLKTVKLAPNMKAQVIFWDQRTPGFGLRVSPGTAERPGARTWTVMGRKRSAERWIPTRVTLGRYPETSLADARLKALEVLARLKTGETPEEIKAASERAADERHRTSFERVGADFIKNQKRLGRRSWQGAASQLERDVYPSWRGRPIDDIKKADVRKVLETILARDAPYAANRTLSMIKRLFAWAVSAGILDVSPALGIEKPASEMSRDRVLSDAELVRIWQAAERLGAPFGGFYKVLILTAQRRGEVACMRWSDLTLGTEKPIWKIAATTAKNGRAHHVPLVDQVVEILKAQPTFEAPGKEFVFSTNGKTAISGFSKPQVRISADVAAGLKSAALPWRMHDLRRTAASGMAELGIAPHVVEAVLNHRSGTVSGVAAVYNRFAYAPEMRMALEEWAARIKKLTA